jgi:hypothetical protein
MPAPESGSSPRSDRVITQFRRDFSLTEGSARRLRDAARAGRPVRLPARRAGAGPRCVGPVPHGAGSADQDEHRHREDGRWPADAAEATERGPRRGALHFPGNYLVLQVRQQARAELGIEGVADPEPSAYLAGQAIAVVNITSSSISICPGPCSCCNSPAAMAHITRLSCSQLPGPEAPRTLNYRKLNLPVTDHLQPPHLSSM